MREKYIEQKLVKATKSMGGLCEKWNAGTSGWPDRIVILSEGKIGFVEIKAPGKEPRKLQFHRHKQLREMGCKVFVIDNETEIRGVLDEIANQSERCLEIGKEVMPDEVQSI